MGPPKKALEGLREQTKPRFEYNVTSIKGLYFHGILWCERDIFWGGDAPNSLSYTWTVAPVLTQAQTLNIHFQLLDSSNTERNFNSKDFKIYNRTDTLTETLRTTTKERTVTKEVTVTPSLDIGSSSSPTSTPADTNTQTTPGTESDEASTTSSSSSSISSSETEVATSMGVSTSDPAVTTSDSSALPNTTNTSSNNTAMKVGLGVGLGVGLPLLALIGGGLYFLGKRRGAGGNTLQDMPSVPPVSSAGAETGWYGGLVGGIDNAGSQAGGVVRMPDGRG
ncbi:hypothetical protein TWF506_008237 [Arthrobotrys conoides]|uniref:Mid2 domain-containing protein n=1 Tax=Arthrobotrys conoides TaxID=74498 RepID=A0AAN8NIT0_9PEZI